MNILSINLFDTGLNAKGGRKMCGMREAAGAPHCSTHPVVREIVQDQSGSERAGGVDATTRVADLQRREKKKATSLTSNCARGFKKKNKKKLHVTHE